MSMTKREKILAAATVFVLAFGLVGSQTRNRIDLIDVKAKAAKDLSDRIGMQRELIDAAGDWSSRYDKVKNQMPVFEMNRQVDTYWLNIMDMAAEEYGVKIRSRSAKDETIKSDVCEFPIEVREWEATLESFLKFFHAIQSEGAMLDIRELKVSPVPNRQGILKGSFVLYCAYMRGAVATEATKAPGISDDKPAEQTLAPNGEKPADATATPSGVVSSNTPPDGVEQEPPE